MSKETFVFDSPDVEVRSDGDRRTICGYAAVYNKPADLGNFIEVIRPGAFDDTLASKPDVSCRIQHAGGLNTIGRTRNGTLRLKADGKGLYYECDVPDTTAGRDILTLIKGGYVTQSSFAFSLRDEGDRWDFNARPPRRELLALDLHDVAPVDGPAYMDTSVAVRSMEAARARATATAPVAPVEAELVRAGIDPATLGDPRRGFEFKAESDTADTAELFIYDVIGWPFIESWRVAKDIGRFTGKTIRVHVNSPGGDVFDGFAIYNALRKHPARVRVEIDGLAASAASVIAMAGDEVVMGKGAFLMIHNAWTIALGDAREMRKNADTLDKIDEQIASVYAGRAKGDEKHFAKLMNKETWFTAEEAVAAGLVDRVEGEGEEELRCDPRWYRNCPKAIEQRAKSPAAGVHVRITSTQEARQRVEEAIRAHRAERAR